VPIIAAAMTTIRIAGDDRGGHDHHSTRAGAEALASRIRRYLAGVTKACALASSERRGTHPCDTRRLCNRAPTPSTWRYGCRWRVAAAALGALRLPISWLSCGPQVSPFE
jgi:hypothetical protein